MVPSGAAAEDTGDPRFSEPGYIEMMRTGFVFLCAAVCAAAQSPVVMISLDGMRPDYTTKADEHGLKVPNLRRFLKDGAYAAGVRGVLPTVTYPSHTTLVTGVEPDKHGVLNNLSFDPELRNMDGWYWYSSDIRVPTLWDAASAAGLVTASLGWPVTVGNRHIKYLIPEYWRSGTSEDRKLQNAISTPGLIDEMEAKFGPFPDGLTIDPPTDQVRTKVALEILREYHPQFFTIHLSALDHAEHHAGPFSAEANATIEKLDGMVGQLIEGALKNDPKTVVVVVSDHGFLKTDHRVNLMIPFVEAGLITLRRPEVGEEPRVTRWEATPWEAGGSAAIMLAHPEDEQVRARVRTMLKYLAAEPENGIARVIEGGEIAKFGGFAGAAFVVEFAPDYMMGGAFEGPLVTDAKGTGMHGYFPDRPELRASFFAMGEGVAAGRDLGVIDMRRIAPTVAQILGVKLPTAEMAALDLK